MAAESRSHEAFADTWMHSEAAVRTNGNVDAKSSLREKGDAVTWESPPAVARSLVENRPIHEISTVPEQSNAREVAKRSVKLMPKPGPRQRFATLEQYEGTVTSVEGEEFVARLRNTLEEEPPQQATFPLNLVSVCDRDLVAEGAVFYWSVGYRIEPHGQRSLSSHVVFRRLPAWSKRDIAKLEERSAALDEFFGE